MTLLDPIWLFLAIPLVVSVVLWPMPSRLLRVLRGAALVCLLLALCGLALTLPSRVGTVVVLADRSESMPPDAEARQKEIIDLVQAEMGPEDRLAVVSFGRTVAVERPPLAGRFTGFLHEVGRDGSNLAEALQAGLGLVPRDAPGRILVLSDGRWTGRDPAAVAAWAAAREVGIDFVPLERTTANDLAVHRIDAPASAAPGESFVITAWVQAPSAQEVDYELYRGTRKISEGRQRLVSGLNRLSFRDRALEPGSQAYTLQVTGAGRDPLPANNAARLLVGVQGPRPLRHVTGAADSGLAKLLRAGGLRLKVKRPDECRWGLDELGNYSAVVLENVPAEKVGTAGMETLAAWVRGTGSGLMMTGGKNAYGPGGYYRSPLEPVLPVSMELRNEHRKLALAIVVVLDRSGSMAMPVGGGRVKMDLANLGAVEVLNMLGPMDEFGCLAVDTVPHTIAELAVVADKGPVEDRIRRIRSQGGGIFVHVALSEAARMLLKAKAATKHIILFSDAADSEEPGNYKELLEKCRDAGITVSVIGLGKPADRDGALLEDIAKLGKGRCFFTDRPEELPRLFAQDTLVVARNTFVDEPTPIRSTAALAALTGRDFELAPLGGYNLCYLRPGASLSALTLDEYKAPVVASWQAGTGRALCYTGEADGKYAGAMARWGQVGDFYTSLARWVAGQSGPLPDNMMVTQEVRQGVNVVRLHLDPERKRDLVTALPRVTTLSGVEGEAPRAARSAMRWAGPDTLEIEVPLRGPETSVTTVEVPGRDQPVSLAPVCLPYSPEFQPGAGGAGVAALDRLGRATGGLERVDLKGIWKELPRRPRTVPVGSWLLLAAVVLVLLEVLERRTGLLSRPRRLSRETETAPRARRRLRWFAWPRWRSAPAPGAPPPAPEVDLPAPEPPKAAPPEPVPAAEDAGGMVAALRQARKRSRARTDQ